MMRVLALIRSGHARLRDSQHLYMVLLAVAVGLGGGLAAVGFRYLIGLGSWVAWGETSYTLDHITALPVWRKLLAPATGGLLCVLIINYLSREAKGHGVPDVMEAVALRSGRIRPRVVLGRMFASAVCIASGGSVGRECPIVQIGSALGSTIGQWLRVDQRRLRTLVACGAAAGIAGTFNAPVAGSLFAAEVILADFGVAQFSPIVISAVAATVVGHHFLGDMPAFVVPTYSLVSYSELFAYAGLGLVCGLAAIAFVRVLYLMEDVLDRARRMWPPLKAAMGGLAVGVIALWFPHVYGVGYQAISAALAGDLGWQLLVALIGLKILATSITIGSGGSGGIFAPSLFIGAMTGGAVGSLVHALWPGATAGPGAYALVGMAAVVGAATHAPITAILIIFELTTDYKIMLPLMISTTIATLLATRLQRGSIYTLKLLRRGVDIYAGRDVSVLKHLLVRDAMRSDPVTLPPGAGILDVIAKFAEHPGTSLFVVDQDGRLLGVIGADESRAVMANAASYEQLLIAEDLMHERGFPTVSPDDTLADVMRRLSRYRGEVPVLEDGRLVGAMWPEDVIAHYNTELFKRDMAAGVVSAISDDRQAEPIPALADTSIVEIPVPPAFVGRSLGSLGIRRRLNVTVLMVRQRDGTGAATINAIPSADYVFRPDDHVLIMGPNDRLHQLERGVVPTP